MKIDITNSGTKDYYDELLFLMNNKKKIYQNSNIKINKVSYSAYKYLTISIILFLSFLVWYLNSKEVLHLCIMILFILLTILSFIYIFLINKRINNLSNSFSETKLEINDKYVSVENENQKYKLDFNDIKKIIIGKYTISFIPKNSEKLFIITRIEYKDELIKALKEYNQDNLVVH